MISFTSVTKSFGDEIFALKDVSFSIEPGELIVITGPSGSGKTTIMRLLTKEYEPTEGEIIFDDAPLSDIKRSQVHELRRKIGVVFQDYKLLPELNVWENIALSLYITGQKQAEIEERVSDLLRLISLDDKPYLFPSQLSGGEAQRVGIARALATAPKVIFADEPTGNLDAGTSASIARLLQKINELGTTVLIATHDISVLDLLQHERHIHLEKGTLMSDEKGDQKSKPITHKSAKNPAPASVAAPMNAPTTSTPESATKDTKVEAPVAAPVMSVETLDDTADTPPKKKFGLGKIWPFGRKQKTDIDTKVESESETEKPSEKTPEPKTKIESLDDPSSAISTPATHVTEPTTSESPKSIKIKTHHPKPIAALISAKSKSEGESL